ncbi:MAG: hypothetical protein ACKOXU_08855 [Limnohabitans sp.]
MSTNLEARLYRLTIALSLVFAIGFGLLCISSVMENNSRIELISQLYKIRSGFQQNCFNNKEDCEKTHSLDAEIREYVIEKAQTEQLGATYLWSAIGIPFFLFLLFFGGRWVLIGELPRLLKKKI